MARTLRALVVMGLALIGDRIEPYTHSTCEYSRAVMKTWGLEGN